MLILEDNIQDLLISSATESSYFKPDAGDERIFTAAWFASHAKVNNRFVQLFKSKIQALLKHFQGSSYLN